MPVKRTRKPKPRSQARDFKVRLNQELVEALDELRGLIPRERYVRDVLEAHVANHKPRKRKRVPR